MASRAPWRSGTIPSADLEAVRLYNLSLVLRRVFELGPRSRATIALETGLNKGTVSRLVAELIAYGLLREEGTRAGGVGRPAQTLAVDGGRVAGIGLGVDVDGLTGLARDMAGNRLAGARVAFDVAARPAEATMEELMAMARGLIEEVAEAGAEVVGIGVAVAGLVDAGRGVVTMTPNLNPSWRNLPLASWLATALDQPPYPILVDNDSNLSALAEFWGETEPGARNVVYVNGYYGLGGAVIVDGRLMRGAGGFGAELGHVVLDTGGPRCGCGRTGCWEALAGLGAVLRRLHPGALAADGRVLDPDQSTAAIAGAAAAGEEGTLEVLAEAGRWLGIGAANLINIFNPDLLVLGGWFADLDPWLHDVAMTQVRDRVVAPALGGTRVRFSSLGRSAAVQGAAGVAIQELVADPGRLAGSR